MVPQAMVPPIVSRAWWKQVHFYKIGLFVASLYLFILAITLMKEGARGIAPLVQNLLAVNNPVNALGFGWLFAYVIMSGSPVAAAALTFFDAGVVDKLGAFAMITGSRLGAGFIVLFLGFLYVLRGRDRATSLSMGLLSLSVTATTYLPALVLGAFSDGPACLTTFSFALVRLLALGGRCSCASDFRGGCRPSSAVGGLFGWAGGDSPELQPVRQVLAADDPEGQPGGLDVALGLPAMGDVPAGLADHGGLDVGEPLPEYLGAPERARICAPRERDPLHHGSEHHHVCGHAAGCRVAWESHRHSPSCSSRCLALRSRVDSRPGFVYTAAICGSCSTSWAG